MNLVEPILYQCKLSPSTTAICSPGSELDSINYRDLGAIIQNISRRVTAEGLAHGAVVAVNVHETILHAAILLALMQLGITSVPVQPFMPRTLQIDATITDVSDVAVGARTIKADRSWLDRGSTDDASDNGNAHPVADDDFCRIVLTSGTTGEPKGIGLSHRMLSVRNATYAYAKGPRFQTCSRLFCDLSISSSPGFRYTIYTLSRGGTVCLIGRDPTAIVQALDLYRIQNMSTSPHGLGQFLQFFEEQRDFECKFDHIVCQGAMLSRELSERVRARMCQNLYSTYGSTEVGTVACGPASAIADISGAVGYVGPGVTLEIVDQEDRPVPANSEGRLRIRSQSMARGYVNDAAASALAFRDGYFYPGDLGYITPDRLLVITGREKTVLNLGGDSIRPEIIEDVVRAFAGVDDVAVCAVPTDLGIAQACALVVTKAALDRAALHQHCAKRLPPWAVPTRFVKVDQIPRLGQGKIQRALLLKLADGATI